jgi:excinuclease UvrABC ATPase subunit
LDKHLAGLKRLTAVAARHNFSVHTPIGELTDEQKHLILYGTGTEKYQIKITGSGKNQGIMLEYTDFRKGESWIKIMQGYYRRKA